MNRMHKLLWLCLMVTLISFWLVAGALVRQQAAEEEARWQGILYDSKRALLEAKRLHGESLALLQERLRSGCQEHGSSSFIIHRSPARTRPGRAPFPQVRPSAPLPASSIQAAGGSPK